MKQRHLWFALCTCLALAFAAHGCGSPLVGLECRAGFSRCGGGCYDLRSDVVHCGGCDLSCGVGESCVESVCTPGNGRDGGTPDAGLLEDAGEGGVADAGASDSDAGPLEDAGEGGVADAGASDDGGSDDGGSDDGGMDARVSDASMDASDDADITRDGEVSDDAGGADAQIPPVLCTGPGSPPDCVCGRGQLACDLVCVEALTDPTHCGMCGRTCDPDEYCAAGVCAPRCDPPLTLCPLLDLCINLEEDVNHCGDCAAPPCATGAACIDGECVGRAVGHIVGIGHDMSASRAPMRTLVGNAVFLARSAPVRVLVYDEKTLPASRLGVANAIQSSAMTLGRTYTTTPAVASQVSLQLSTADVFVIEVQQDATDMELSALGQLWAVALDEFLGQGGVIVLFEGGGANDGTYQILSAAGLLDIASRTNIPRGQYELWTPTDAIGAGMPSKYQSEGQSAVFNLGPRPPAPVEVVREPTPVPPPPPPMTPRPVVIHLPVLF